jgi:hypothetical protein
MPFRLARMAICLIGLILVASTSGAAPIATCNASFTMCFIPEEIQLQLPFTAFAGDAILMDPGTSTVSDVFRIFNNVVDTGKGTGLGNLAFLYSADEGPLPSPSTYSANAVFLSENPSGATPYLGNGTTYLLGTPEPRTDGMIILICLAMPILARRRSGITAGGMR